MDAKTVSAAAGPSVAGGLEGGFPPARALTVVVPTFNERENIPVLIDRLARTLGEVAWQVIVVDDDSPDGTAGVVKAIAAADGRVSCLRRIGRRGLAGAVVEGIMAASAPIVAVIDADLQHDETLLPTMLEHVRADRADLVIGSRYLRPGAVALGLSPTRRAASRLAAWLARRVLKADVSDPVSGFFMVRQSVVEAVAPRLSSHGFKILFDIIASQPAPLRILELPYDFIRRRAGESKFDGRVAADYLALVMARLTGDLIPPRAVMFGMVGASGLIVHLAVLCLCHGLGARFAAAQLIAALTAMTSNYLINNAITYRDRRLAGATLFTGYLRFAALCAIGLVANVAVADLVHRWTPAWWLAGAAGALFGAAWNYVSTSVAVW